MNWLGLIEVIAVVCGLLSVWLTVRQNILCWPTGLLQVALYIVIFYQAKLYSDMILQVIYVALQIYGWYHWLFGAKGNNGFRVTKSKASEVLSWTITGLAGMLVWGYVMHRYTDAAAPYPDAFIVAFSLIAQWLMARKRLDSWFFWIVVDLLAIVVYIYKELYLTTGLYLVFLFLCWLGLSQWKKSLHDISAGVTATA